MDTIIEVDVPGLTHKRPLTRVLIGLGFIAIATLVLLQTFGVISLNLGGANILWLAGAALLAIISLGSLFHLNWGGFFLPAAGIYTILALTTNYFPWENKHIGIVWLIAFLLTIGFTTLFHRRNKTSIFHGQHGDESTDSQIHLSTNFGSLVKYITSDNFESCDLECNFGAAQLYFDQANIKQDRATLTLRASFCGVELYVPSDWTVLTDDLSLMLAGADNNPRRSRRAGTSGKATPNADKTLVIQGSLSFGGLEINYV